MKFARHPGRLLFLACLFALAATASSAKVFDVGPAKAYTHLGAVPWSKLAPGDTVAVYWQPQAYHEKLRISCQGTTSQPITIVGVPGPTGQLPIIDGQNATTDSQFVFAWPATADRGVIIFTAPWGSKPAYIELRNLDIRNAYSSNTYTDGQGLTRKYEKNAAAVFVERGENIKVQGCTISGSGNGLFVASSSDEEQLSRDITVENCAIFGNGNVGSDREHNVYTECERITFQYNYLGPLRPGALGNNLKDRSAGTVIRYNWIYDGAHLLDLVEAQDSWVLIGSDPAYHQTYVYGNVLVNDAQGAGTLVHYGGDNGFLPSYRKGTLYFYNNTIVNIADQTGDTGRWRTMLFNLETNQEAVDVRNNILYSAAATPGRTPADFSFLGSTGTLTCGVNWISPGWLLARTGVPFIGTANGMQNLISNASNTPGFANLAGLDLHLAAGSPCISTGGEALAAESGVFAVNFEYQAPRSCVLRHGNSQGPDMGAYGYGTPIPLHRYTIRGQVTWLGQGLVGATVSLNSGQSALTASDGTYELPDLSAGFYTVSAAKSGYVLSANLQVTLNTDAASVDFTATEACAISGKVTYLGQGLAGAAVSILNGPSVTTAADGTYSLAGLQPGAYTVTAGKANYTLSPPQNVQASRSSTGVNFTATSNDQAVQLVSLTLTKSKVVSYERPDATITLNKPVPGTNITVKVTSSNPGLVPVSDIVIWGGQTSKSFNVITYEVTQPTNVTITATYGGVTQTVTLTIVPR